MTMWYALMIMICTVATGLGIASVWRMTSARRRRLLPVFGRPSISVLKPLCGADDALEANLETFFVQDYPAWELVFGVEGEEDPAVEVVRRLRARHPAVACRLVIHGGGRAINPKVSNLRAMLAAGSHDVVVISDSNVAVETDYLSGMAGHLRDPGVGLVTSLVSGVGERTVGAALDNLHLMGPVAGSVASSQALWGRTLVVGKSMMFRRSVLESLGGLESVATVLAEDYVIGRMFGEAGYEVRLAEGVVQNVAQGTSVEGFLRRQLRWGLLRSRLKPLAYPFEPLLNPMAVALVAPWFGVTGALPLAWAFGLVLLRDGLQVARLRGTRGLAVVLPLGPVKDLLMVAVWALAPFALWVSWRGRRYRVSAGTRVYAPGPLPAPREAAPE